MAKRTKYANLGMDLEEQISLSNQHYQTLGLAMVTKVATPVKVIKKVKKIITEAFYLEKSTVDFIGNIGGRFVNFDAKETAGQNEFPLKNVKSHQFEFLQGNYEQNGLSFLIIRFLAYEEIYILSFDQLREWWKPGKKSGLGSIPYDFFKNECKKCNPGRNLAIDYLASLET